MSEERLTRLEVKVDHTDRELQKLAENINKLVSQLERTHGLFQEMAVKDQQFISQLEMISSEVTLRFEALRKEIRENRERIDGLTKEKNYYSRIVLSLVFTAVISLVVVKTKILSVG